MDAVVVLVVIVVVDDLDVPKPIVQAFDNFRVQGVFLFGSPGSYADQARFQDAQTTCR